MKRLLTIALILCLATLSLVGCAPKAAEQATETPTTPTPAPTPAPITPQDFSSPNNPVITMTMSDGAEVKIELYPAIAKNTVNNFISLTQKGFYDGLTFHRIISGFMIQGGDPDGTGTGGPAYGIKGEFKENGVENPLLHTRGVISMARSMENDSAGSQFFIMHADVPDLDGKYAAFGKVISGIETVDQIAAVKTGQMDAPIEKVVIKKMTVELNGYAFTEPEVIK